MNGDHDVPNNGIYMRPLVHGEHTVHGGSLPSCNNPEIIVQRNISSTINTRATEKINIKIDKWVISFNGNNAHMMILYSESNIYNHTMMFYMMKF